MKKVWISIALLILMFTACVPQTPTDQPSIIIKMPTSTSIPANLTPAQRAAIAVLSENLGLPADKITMVSTEAVDWPDECFGIVIEGLSCAPVITPGFRVVLEANGRQVEYRTNEDGTQLRPATAVLTWKREGGIAGFCDYMTVYLSGEAHGGSCKQGQYAEVRLIDVLSQEEIAKLDKWLQIYGNISIDASNPKGVSDRMVVVLTLLGTGSQQTLSTSNEQELLNFAQELHQRLDSDLK
ncbi:MAG TPA: hypothetical protein VFD54_07790 [Anaerolineales bacterium]|nr:hypothetical protein [Anaerolineales bacterium]